MVDTTNAKLKLNIILEPGEVLGEKEVKDMIIRTLNSLDLPKTKVTPKFDMKADLATLTKEIAGVHKEVQAALDREYSKTTTQMKRLPDAHLKRMKTAFDQMDLLASRVQGYKSTFDTPEFRAARKAVEDGYIIDQNGKRREVNARTIDSLKDVTLSKGSKTSVFPLGTKDSLKQYSSELLKMAAALDQVEASASRVRGKSTLTDRVGNLALGTSPGGKQRLPNLLAEEAQTAREQAKTLRKAILTDKQIAELEAKEAQEAIRKAERDERRAEAAQRRFDARARKLAAEEKTRVSERAARAEESEGIKQYDRIKKGGPASLRQYEQAAAALNTRLDRANKQVALLNATKPKGFKEQLKDTNQEAERLSKELQHLKSIKNQVLARGERSILPIGGVAGKKGVPYTPSSNAEIVGRQAFLASGAHGGSLSIPKEELGAAAAYHTKRIKELTKAQEKLPIATAEGRKQFDKMGKSLFLHSRDLEHVQQRMQQFGSITQQTSALFRQFFRYALGYGALYQVLAAVRALTAGVVQLDEALNNIKAVTQATNAEMRKIESGIKSVALETQFNTKDISEAAVILGQAGVIPKDLPAALRATALFSSATGSAIQLSADLITSLRNVFTDLSDTSISNLMTQAINISKLTAGDLKTVVSLSGQIAKSYNLTADKYFAAVTTLRNAGLKPSTVATGLRQGLLEVFSPDSKTIKALATRYKQLGEELSTDAIRDKFFGFSLTDSPLVTALRELDRLGFTGSGKKTFQRAYDVRAENAISALINNLDELEGASAKLTFGEAALVAAQTQMDSLSHSLSNLGAAISVFASDVGQPLVDIFEGWSDGATKFVQRLTELNTQLQITKGYGVEVAGLTALIAGVIGGKLFPGGLPGKAIVGTGIAAAAANLATPELNTEEAEDPEAAKGAIKKIWDSLGSLGQTVLLALGPVLSVELVNKLRSKGSPLIDKVLSGKRLGSGAAAAGGAGAYSIISGKAGAAAAGAAAGAATAGTGVKTLAKAFSSPAWLAIKTWGGKLVQFLRVHPVVKAILTMYAVVTSFTALADLLGDKQEASEKKYKAALKNRDRTADAYQRLLESQAEFTLGAFGKKAAKGTTAESIDNLQEDLDSYEKLAKDYFGAEQVRVTGLTEKLLELNAVAPEEGTDAREERIDAIKNSLDTAQVKTELTPAILNDLANRVSSFTSRGEALKGAIATYYTNLSEKANLSGSSLAFKKAYDNIIANNTELEAVIFGYETGATPEESTRIIIDTAKKLADEQKRIFDAMDETRKVQRDEIEGRRVAIKALTQEIINAPSGPALTAVLRDYGATWSGLADTSIEGLQKVIEEMEAQIAIVEAKLNIPKNSDRIIAELEADRDARPAATTRGGVKKRLGSGNAAITAAITAAKKLREEALAEEEANRAEREGLIIGKGALEKLKADKIAARTKDSLITGQKYRTEISTAQDFAPGAKTDERAALERTGADLTYIDDLLTKSQEELDAALAPDSEGGLSGFAEQYVEALATITKVRLTLRDQNAEYAQSFHQDLETYKKINDAKTAIDKAKDAKDYSLLATSDEAKNLYKILEKLTIADLHKQITFLQNKPVVGDKEKDTRDKAIYELENKQDDAKEKAIRDINEAEVKLAEQALAEFKKANQRKLAGLTKQRDIAIDSGDFFKALDLDKKILAIKQQILDLELKRLTALKASDVEKENFKADSEADLIPELSKPASARTITGRKVSRLAKDFPDEVPLSEDDRENAYLRQQGIVASRDSGNEYRAQQVDALLQTVSSLEADLAALPRQPDGTLNEETVAEYEQKIKLLEEKIGELQGESQDNQGFVNGALGQVKKGFDLLNVSNKIDSSASSISNLGNVIQDDLVSGLDDAAGGFANALANGESFTDGLRQSFSDMFRQIAADMIKSGILSLFSAGATSAGFSFPALFGGAKTGGPVEKLAGGGVISGPGTGTSDSISGVIIDGAGNVRKGVAVSDGEGIVTAKGMNGLGVGFLNYINKASTGTLKAIRRGFSAAGYRNGGVPSPVRNAGAAAYGARMAFSTPVMGYASGGLIKDASGMSKSIKPNGSGATVEHNLQTNVNIEASEDTGMTLDDLRRLDDGINLKVQEYIEEQMRPGGVLQSARQR